MTDKEWLEKIKNKSNEELIHSLIHCGHDGYYNDLYYPIIKEIERRLGVNNE